MDVWLGRCNKTSTCSHCGEDIELGEPEIFGKLWMKFGKEGGEPRRWAKKFHWHAVRKKDKGCCWLDQALEDFRKRPHVEKRGRKKIAMPAEMREKRLKLLRKRAKVIQQLKGVMEVKPAERSMDEIIRLGSILEELKVQIQEVGGVPKSWR